MKTITNQATTLEEFKKDLIWQLSFENVDWGYFKDILELAIESDEDWHEIYGEDI